MTHFSRVLVGVDFSEPASEAFEYALALGKDHGAEIVALQAVPPDERFSWEARERRALVASLRQRAEAANVAFTDRVQRGDPAEIILLHARSLHPDVIVMGTHQRRGLERLRTGSVGAQVVAKATVPVLVVSGGQHGGAIRPFRHVAVAVDFGAATDAAIEHASALASDPWGRITLLHVAPSSSAVPAHLLAYSFAEFEDTDLGEARRRLDALATRVKPHAAVDVHHRVLVGDTTSELRRALDSIGADIVIVGVPKRGTISRALFGTTATRLLQTIRIPMLTIPDTMTATARLSGDALKHAA